METQTIIICILVLLIIVLSYTTFNLLRKNEKYEDMLDNYRTFIQIFQKRIKDGEDKLKEIDSRGSFSSDDEVGYFFQELKKLWYSITNFKVEE